VAPGGPEDLHQSSRSLPGIAQPRGTTPATMNPSEARAARLHVTGRVGARQRRLVDHREHRAPAGGLGVSRSCTTLPSAWRATGTSRAAARSSGKCGCTREQRSRTRFPARALGRRTARASRALACSTRPSAATTMTGTGVFRSTASGPAARGASRRGRDAPVSPPGSRAGPRGARSSIGRHRERRHHARADRDDPDRRVAACGCRTRSRRARPPRSPHLMAEPGDAEPASTVLHAEI